VARTSCIHEKFYKSKLYDDLVQYIGKQTGHKILPDINCENSVADDVL